MYAAGIEPGHAVVVAGVGGIGAAAIQGARHAGAKVVVAIDPVESKREKALSLGATHVAASWQEAPGVVAEATWDRGADRFICAMGIGRGSCSGRRWPWSASAAGSSSPTCRRRRSTRSP